MKKRTNKELAEGLLRDLLREPDSKIEEENFTFLEYRCGLAAIQFIITHDKVEAVLMACTQSDTQSDMTFEEREIVYGDCPADADLDADVDTIREVVAEFYQTTTFDSVGLDILLSLIYACNNQFKSLLQTTGEAHDRIFKEISEEDFCKSVEFNLD